VAEAAYRSSCFHDESVKAFAWRRWLAPLFYLFPEKRARVDFSYMFLPVRASGRLLEVGFGSGKSLDRLARSGWSVEGIDFDEAAVENAKKRGLPVKAGDLRAQCYPDNYFDAIVSSHAVEHLHDPKGFLQECWRILKPGGQLALMTPNAKSFGARFFGAAWFALDPPRHLMLFSAQSLRNIGLQAGFSSAEARFNARDAHNVFIGSRHIANTGRHQWSDRGGLFMQLWGRFWQTVEWIAGWLKPSVGEELVVVFRK
jgi:SAM-dependent methyltransferase